MKKPVAGRKLSFHARLDRMVSGMEYYVLTVPAKITKALGTTKAVPVSARVNGSTPFLISLYPKGGGQHGLRVKNTACVETKITEGDRVRVDLTIRDHAAEASPPADLARALRAKDRLNSFLALPPGRRSFAIRQINQAAKPETRAKRIQAVVDAVG